MTVWLHIATSQSFASLDQFSVEKSSKLKKERAHTGFCSAFLKQFVVSVQVLLLILFVCKSCVCFVRTKKRNSPNTFLMVRFKCCFSMDIVTVIQFVLKVFFSFSLSRDGPLETYGGGGRITNKIFAQGKIKWKKFHTRQLTLKRYLCYGLTKSYKEFANEKDSCGSSI